MFIAAWLPKPWVLTSVRQADICRRFRKGPEYPLHNPSPIFSEDNSTGHRSPFLLGKCFLFFLQFRRNMPEAIIEGQLSFHVPNTKSTAGMKRRDRPKAGSSAFSSAKSRQLPPRATSPSPPAKPEDVAFPSPNSWTTG